MALSLRNLTNFTQAARIIFGHRPTIQQGGRSGWRLLTKMRKGLSMMRWYQKDIDSMGLLGWTPSKMLTKQGVKLRRLKRGKSLKVRKGQGKIAQKRAAEAKRAEAKAAKEKKAK